MLPGRFLGIARTTGDAFTFVITTDNGISSVIRRRDIKSGDPYADYNTEDMEVEETDGGNNQIEGSQNNLSGDISDHEGNSVPQQGSFDEVIISDMSSTTIHAENDRTTPSCAREVYDHFDTELKCEEIDEIISSKFGESDGKLYLQVRWRDGQESYVSAELVQSDDPIRLARYIKDNPVERLRGGFWSQWADRALQAISHSI